MENESLVAVALGVLLGFGALAASCDGHGTSKKDAGDASQTVSPDGPQGTGGATTSPPGGATGGIHGSGTGGMTGTGGTSTGGSGTSTTPGCCGVDRTCPSGYSCAGNVDLVLANIGQCEPTPTNGCYNDVDCPQDGLCRSAVTCACNADCFAPSRPGTCERVGEPCCHTAEDCTDGQRCVGSGAYIKGRCMAPPTSGQCYTSGDCSAGRFCSGAKTCPCGTNCTVQPGNCAIN